MLTEVSRGEDMLLQPLTPGCRIMAYIFSSTYEGWNKDSYSILCGIRFGILIGLFLGAGIGLIMYATELRTTAIGHFVDSIFWVTTYAITGIVASIVYKR